MKACGKTSWEKKILIFTKFWDLTFAGKHQLVVLLNFAKIGWVEWKIWNLDLWREASLRIFSEI